MDEEKCMAGDFEITQAIQIGDKEIIFGINDKDVLSPKYMCGYCESNELFASYSECMVSDGFVEIIELFAKRICKQAEKTREEQAKMPSLMPLIRAEECFKNDYRESIDGEVIAIRPDVLRRDCRSADKQIYLCTGGFGSNANSRGSACFCTNIYSGKSCRWERRDIQGVIKPEAMSAWVNEKLAAIKSAEHSEKTPVKQDKESR